MVQGSIQTYLWYAANFHILFTVCDSYLVQDSQMVQLFQHKWPINYERTTRTWDRWIPQYPETRLPALPSIITVANSAGLHLPHPDGRNIGIVLVPHFVELYFKTYDIILRGNFSFVRRPSASDTAVPVFNATSVAFRDMANAEPGKR